jgi:hypothetical protein
MYCGHCGAKIPDDMDACPSCGWQKTVQHAVPFKRIKKKIEISEDLKDASRPESSAVAPQEPPPSFSEMSAPAPAAPASPREAHAAAPAIAPRFKPMIGCFTAGILAVVLFLTGTVLLFNHRGFAWEIWQESEAVTEKKPAKSQEERDPLMDLRDELLSISAQISGMERGLPFNAAAIKKRLSDIEEELNRHKGESTYFRVYALHKSVEFQFELTEKRELETDMPSIPYSPIAPKHSTEYVMKHIEPNDLLKGKMLKGGQAGSIRYGPALFGFENKLKTYTELYWVDAPEGYRYVEAVITVDGIADLVEYTVRMLDDYQRAFPPYLGAEKQARKKTLPKNHMLWRDTLKTEKGKTVYLHRIFLLPADAVKKPILEIVRQGSSKMIWVQY